MLGARNPDVSCGAASFGAGEFYTEIRTVRALERQFAERCTSRIRERQAKSGDLACPRK